MHDAASLPETLREHLVRPVGAGEPDPAEGFRRGLAENPACGDVLVLHVREGAEGLDVRFQARGCSAVLAVASFLCERLAGLDRAGALAFDLESEIEELGGLPRPRRHAIAVGQRALRDALAAR